MGKRKRSGAAAGMPPAKRSKKKQAKAPVDTGAMLVSELVRDYADDWEQWAAFVENNKAKVAAARLQLWDHVKQYKESMLTWADRGKRKAYRGLYRLLRPGSSSGSLAPSAGSVQGSPLVLPQLAFPPASLAGTGPPSGAAVAGCAGVLTLLCASTRWRPHRVCPQRLVVHGQWKSHSCVDHFHCHLPAVYTAADPPRALSDALRPRIDSVCNAFVNTRGGQLVVGVPESGTVQGLPLTRNLRDRIRRDIDTVLERWSPPCDTRRLVDVRFVEVHSSKCRAVQGHYVVYVIANALRHSEPVRNSTGVALKWTGNVGSGGSGDAATYFRVCAGERRQPQRSKAGAGRGAEPQGQRRNEPKR